MRKPYRAKNIFFMIHARTLDTINATIIGIVFSPRNRSTKCNRKQEHSKECITNHPLGRGVQLSPTILTLKPEITTDVMKDANT